MIKRLIVISLLVFSSYLASGAELALDVTGRITNYTDREQKRHHLNEDDLLSFKRYSIRTSTNWTGVERFVGFLLSDLLNKVGATGDKLEIHCLDGYQYTIPVSDATRYKLVLAYEREGQRMSVKKLGPLGLIYPRDQYPAELKNAATDAKFTWQVSKIVVK